MYLLPSDLVAKLDRVLEDLIQSKVVSSILVGDKYFFFDLNPISFVGLTVQKDL